MKEDKQAKIRQQIEELQQLQQQLQLINEQEARLEARKSELESTLEELNQIEEDTPLYKNVGSVLMLVKDKNHLKNEMKEDLETMEVKLKSVKKQEEQMKNKFRRMQEDLEALISGYNSSSGLILP